ncbi:MAG: putative glycoside hydrolase, partial [Bryobacteraceae bacterium]
MAPLCAIAGSNNNNAGNVQFYLRTSSAFNTYTDHPSSSMQSWIYTHFWRLQSNSTYFDKKLSWMPNTWDYVDLYGIHTDSDIVKKHPEWILHDSDGNRLYIPFACSNGVCDSYAGDITNSEFRNYWISQVQSSLSAGYKGIWLDDVNMEFRVSNGSGDQVAPWDNDTNATMTWDNWRMYVAQFVEQIRSAFPTYEIVHNSIWYATPTRTADPYVIRQIKAADYINCERGVSDPGLTGGTGSWSLNAFLSYIDVVHSYGTNVLLDEYNFNGDYGLAGYFLISNGNDSVGNQDITPDNWWTGYETQLGPPAGDRYTWNGLLRRDFASGMVLLNPPKSATVTVTLPTAATKIDDGSLVTSVTLDGSEAVVLTIPSGDFALSLSTGSTTVAAGNSSSLTANLSFLGSLLGKITFSASGLPSGASASFSPSFLLLGGTSTLNISTSSSTPPGTYNVVVSGAGIGTSHTATLRLTVTSGGGDGGIPTTVPVDLSSVYNRTGIVNDGTTFSGGLDSWGNAYSAQQLGRTVTANSVA